MSANIPDGWCADCRARSVEHCLVTGHAVTLGPTPEQRAEEYATLVGALLVRHGELIGTDSGPSYRETFTVEDLERLERGRLSVNLDPCSGALLLRFRPE